MIHYSTWKDMTTFFITASDTNVGKTYITKNLLRLFLEQDYIDKNQTSHVRAIKPIETGFSYHKGIPLGSDVDAYTKISPANNFPPVYSFNVAASPHYSARLENVYVNIDKLENYCREHISQSNITLIEGAGGLLVPFNDSCTNLNRDSANKSYNFTHLIKRLKCPIIMVIQNKLGAINQALMNIQLCDFHGIDIACLVMNQTNPDNQLALENINYLRKQSDIPVVQINKDGSFEDFRTAFEGLFSDLLHEDSEIKLQNLNFDQNHLWHPYTSMTEPLRTYHVNYAEGKYIYVNDDANTHKLIDAMSSWWAVNLGYNREDINRSAIRQINQFSHVMFGGLTHQPAIDLGKTLIDILPTAGVAEKNLEHIFYTDSGSVSVEVAIKMALQYQQANNPAKRKILTPLGGYHGDTFGAMSVCDPINGMHGLFEGILAEQIFIPRPSCRYDAFSKNKSFDPSCLEPLNQALSEYKDEIAGIIIEPIVQGAGGMWLYHPDYLRHLRVVCDKYDIVLIFDEIATGFGRTGSMFASELVGIIPDIICLGKALTGGFMSFGCTIASHRVAKGISQDGNPFMHGPTYMGNPLACTVAKKAIDTLVASNWQSQIKNIESWLINGLTPCKELSVVSDVRVLGAIGIVEMYQPVNIQKIQKYFVSQGVWIRPFGKLIYTMPHFNFDKSDVEQICKVILEAIMNGEY